MEWKAVRLFFTILLTLWSVRCDIFADEAGETDIIPIDDFHLEKSVLKSSLYEPCEEKIPVHTRPKRDDYGSESEDEDEEGSGEGFEDDKEVGESTTA